MIDQNETKMKEDKTHAINTGAAFLEGADMSSREGQILKDIVAKTGFSPKDVLWRSSYYGTDQIGAVHYNGEFDGQAAVLKIQGVKPEISEIFMINSFQDQNKSKLVRPPKLFSTFDWNDASGYEALIMEKITGSKIVESGKLQSPETVGEFFRIFQEYRVNCLNSSWLPKPEKPLFKEDDLAKFEQMAKKVKPESKHRQPQDMELVRTAALLMNKIWQDVDIEFVHGHFSAEDLIRQNDQVVLFSNLFWKWKFPYYDAVFAYHWFMYSLAGIKDITPEQVEQQRKLWLDEIYGLNSEPKNQILIKAALLERASMGLLIDSVAYIDETNPISGYMVESTREQVKELTKALS